MTDEFTPIRARTVPLTRAAAPADARPSGAAARWRTAVVLGAAALLLAVVFLLVPRLVESPAPTVTGAPRIDPTAVAPVGPQQPASDTAASGTAPFAQLQREEARTAAQAALSRFVELQRTLESQMQVGAWGNEALERAKERAAAADEAFVRDEYEVAVQGYQAAAADLEALIAEGARLLEEAVAQGEAALVTRDAAAAAAAFERAAQIAPNDPRVGAGTSRALRIPEVNELMRTARNHELAGEWSAALEALRAVERLDPDTSELADALARVNAAAGRSQLQTVISQGFAHLDGGRLDAARAAFQDALRRDPGNSAALGGLEQVGREEELSRLDSLQQRADTALAEERWADAETLYAEALALDPNIQFAIVGRGVAQARQQADAALAAIVADPDRLSSSQAYDDARRTLAAAETLEGRGPGLNARIEQVRGIIETYANPVPVTLRSDNRTHVTVSSVGALGAFAEKQLVLRPGAYTVVGSRDGCRDVRARILVRPDMGPVDIRCTESL